MNGECEICKRWSVLEKHHVYGGANRKQSEQDKLLVYLCHYCHNEPPNGVHFNKDKRLELQAKTQIKAMDYYGWTKEEFMARYGKNYI